MSYSGKGKSDHFLDAQLCVMVSSENWASTFRNWLMGCAWAGQVAWQHWGGNFQTGDISRKWSNLPSPGHTVVLSQSQTILNNVQWFMSGCHENASALILRAFYHQTLHCSATGSLFSLNEIWPKIESAADPQFLQVANKLSIEIWYTFDVTLYFVYMYLFGLSIKVLGN